MDANDFFSLCENAFTPLMARHHLAVAKSKSSRDVWRWTIKNTTSGIVVLYEVKAVYLGVQVCRLVDGQIRETTGEIGPDTELHCFDLFDFLSLCEPAIRDSIPLAGLESPDRLDESLKAFAQAAEACAADALDGDFEQFRSLDLIVKQRAREAAFQKWGDRARDFGW